MSAVVIAVVAGGVGGWAWATAAGHVRVLRRLHACGRGAGLAVYPLGGACVTAAQIALWVRGPVGLVAAGVAAVLVAWMIGARLGRGRAGVTPPGGEVIDRSGDRAGPIPRWRPLRRGPWIVDFGPCGRCGSLAIASGRLDRDPAAVAARATCTGCGARLVGVENPDSPGQLVWTAQPGMEDIA